MVGKYDLRTGGNLEMLRVDSLGLQLFHFLKETFRVNDNARTDDTDGTGIHNAARHKAQRISFAAGHNRMSRVVPLERTTTSAFASNLQSFLHRPTGRQ